MFQLYSVVSLVGLVADFLSHHLADETDRAGCLTTDTQ